MNRMGPERIPKQMFSLNFNGKRRRGRPRLRWTEMVYKDIAARGQDPRNMRDKRYDDRIWWRGLVHVIHDGTTKDFMILVDNLYDKVDFLIYEYFMQQLILQG